MNSRKQKNWPGAHHELFSLLGIAILVIATSQLFESFNPTLVTIIALSYVAANSLVTILIGHSSVKRHTEHALIGFIIWLILINLI